MSLTIPLKTIELTPGSHISIPDITWQDFEQILIDLGEKRNTRVAYYQGLLEIMSPLASHERPHRIIADIVKAILETEERDWEDFGSTTLKRPLVAGIEPDTCFYIDNAALVKGCTNLNLDDYPPPDLAIESDVTSKTSLNAYQAIRVAEIWIYQRSRLKIYRFSEQGYQETPISPSFPHLPLTTMIPELIQKAIYQGTRLMLRDLKKELEATKMRQ